MHKKSKIIIFSSILIILICSLIFVFTNNQISNIIDRLNGRIPNKTFYAQPQINKNQNDNIRLVNTTALGKNKLNLCYQPVPNHINSTAKNIEKLCRDILTNEGQIYITCSKDNTDTEILVCYTQFLAGENYNNVKNYYLSNYDTKDAEQATKYLNYNIATTLNLNINDVPYINLQKNVKEYLKNNGFTKQDITNLQNKLKEDCN